MLLSLAVARAQEIATKPPKSFGVFGFFSVRLCLMCMQTSDVTLLYQLVVLDAISAHAIDEGLGILV